MEKDEWILSSLSLYHSGNYGDDANKLVGSVTFKNGTKSSLSFKVDADVSRRFMALIQDEIIASAKQMSQQLITSLPLQIENNSSKQLPVG